MDKKSTFVELEQRIKELEKEAEKHEQVKDALRVSEKKYKSLYDHMNEGVCLHEMVCDENGAAIDYRIIDVNHSYESITGLSKNKALGALASELYETGDPPFLDIYSNVAKTGQSTSFELYWPPMNKYFLISVFSPEANMFATVFNDITKRRKAEEELRYERDLSKRVMEATPAGITRVDADGRIVYANRRAEEILGIRLSEGAQRTYNAPEWKITDLDGNPFPEDKLPFYLVQQTHEPVLGIQHAIEWPNGRRVLLSVNAVPLLDDSGAFEGMVAIIEDITDRKRMEEEKKKLETQLQHAQKMEAIGTLAGGIAHDFNNILTPVIIQTELALLHVTDDSPMKNSLHEVLVASHRAKDLVKQILTFSRQTEARRVSLKVTPIIQEALGLLRSTLPTTIRIEQNIQAETEAVLADPTQIHQVLMNLCTNAAHAIREKEGVLTVGLSEMEIKSGDQSRHPVLVPGKYLRLSVGDNGHGIDPTIRGRIFEPFFTTKDRSEGTGMGLSVVHGIAKSHGGAVEFETEPGKGTTFHVFFPRTASKRLEQTEPTAKLPTGDEHVLLVDDEKTMIDSVGAMLKYLGYKVTAKTSSTEALETFCAKPNEFDLVITDMTMPNMRGDQLARRLIEIKPDIPIVLCTGFSEMISEEKAKAMGIREFVMKPIMMKDMARTVRKALDE